MTSKKGKNAVTTYTEAAPDAQALTTVDPATLPVLQISGDVLQSYVAEGMFSEAEAPALESVASFVRGEVLGAAASYVRVGAVLNQVKDGMAHGSWQFFVERRCGLSMDTAQRSMASARLIQERPELADYLGMFSGRVLSLLAQNKQVNDDVIDEVLAHAATTEVTESEVRAIIDDVNPKPASQKQHKLGFRPMNSNDAQDWVDGIGNYADKVGGNVVKHGADLGTVRKHPDFKAWVKAIMAGTDDSSEPFDKSLSMFLAACFVVRYSYITEQETDAPPTDQPE